MTKEIKHQICGDGFIQYHPIKQVAQPEQEPVAWLHWLHGPVRLFMNKDEAMMELDRLNREYPVDSGERQMKPLYTTPPKRTWVDLTDEQMWNAYTGGSDIINLDYAKSILELFKGKNNG